MRSFFVTHKYYFLGWLIGLCAAIWIGCARIEIEEANHSVEMVYDYGRVSEYALAEGKTTDEMLHLLGNAGITSFAVYDETPKKLQDEGHIQITRYPASAITYVSETPRIEPIAYILSGNASDSKQYYQELVEDLSYRLPEGSIYPFISVDGRNGTAVLGASYEGFLDLNTGISSVRMKNIANHGFGVVVRPTNYVNVSDEDVQHFWQRIDAGGGARAIMFVGSQVLGYPDKLEVMAKKLRNRHIPVAVIEAPNQLQFELQKGVIDLWRFTDLQGIRSYSMYRDELVKLDAQEASQRHFISDIERNIRLNLFASYKRPIPGKTIFESDLEYIRLTGEKLTDRGFTLGESGVLERPHENVFAQLLVLLGIVSVTMLAFRGLLLWKRKFEYIVAIILYAILAIWMALAASVLPHQIAALLAAIMTPVAVIYVIMNIWKTMRVNRYSLFGLVGTSIGVLSGATFLSLSGGWLLGAILTSPEFLLEIEIFRGVKLAFVLPVVLVACLYVRHYQTFLPHPVETVRDIWEVVRKILSRPVTIGALAVMAVLTIGALVFVGRSGHTGGIPVAGAEIRFRRILETFLSARPRIKEFLIGHPSLLLVPMACQYRCPRWIHFLLMIGAGIGQASIVETFAHMRSPLLMSTERGINGLMAGILIGLVALFICHLVTQIADYGRTHYEKN